MTDLVPTIRAGVLAPILHWMVDHGMPIEEALQEVHLGAWIAEDADGFAPILNAAELLRCVGRRVGPDVFCRIGDKTDFSEVGAIGTIARSRQTPREALRAIVDFMPSHCTHERIAVADMPEGVRFTDSWRLKLDAEAQHLIHQYVATLVHSICAATAATAPLFSWVEIVPHPTAGVAHLHPWFGRVEAATSPRLVIDISARVADARMRPVPGDAPRSRPDLIRLPGEGRFVESVRWAIVAIMGAGSMAIEDIAAAAGMSTRTLQRRLARFDIAFSDLLDATRRDLALRLLESGALPVGEVAARLSYANASALSRAVRRWTGQTPQAIRARAHAANAMRRKIAGRDGVRW